tara:strand:- start:305 stop:1516 length:1212 start_codon:yes stop_codon:yes gene_type:complete
MLGLGLGTTQAQGLVDALAQVTNTKSIIFDGGDEYIQLSDPFNYTQHTISAWFKVIDDGNEKLIFENVDGTSDGIHLRLNSSEQIKYKLNNTTISSTSTGLSGSWHHVVVTYDGTTYCLYLNGVLETTGTVSQTINVTTNARIGSSSSAASNYFEGNIDEVAIWNEALTATEATQIYNSGTANLDLSTNSGDYSSSANLKGWWRMGDGTLDEHPLVADQTNLTLATSIVQNGDFEDTIAITSSGYPNHNYVDETSNSGQDLTISTDTSNPRNGSQCMKLTLTGATSGEANYKIEDIPAGLYKISIFARNGVSQNSAKIRLGGHTLLRSFASADSGSIDLTDSYQEIVAYLNLASTTTIFFTIGVTNGTDGHHILVDDFSVQKFNGNAGLMTNMTSGDIVTDTP